MAIPLESTSSKPSRSHANCTRCGLFLSGCSTPFMKGYGPGNGIAIVGEAPGKQEDDQGRAFVGAHGTMLRKALSARGIDPSLCFWTSAVRCKPGDGKVKAKHVALCRSFLFEELQRVKPKAILLVGNFALMGVLKRGGIMKQRRNVLRYSYADESGSVDVPCVACLSPAYIAIARDMKPEFEGDLDFFASLVKSTTKDSGIEIVNDSEAKRSTKGIQDLTATVSVNFNPTLEDVEAFAAGVREKKSVVGYDTETDTLRPYVDRDFSLLCVGMSDGKNTLVVRCDVPKTPTVDTAILRYGENPTETKKKLRVLLDLLRDSEIRKAAHSSKYDYHVINSRFGIRVRNLWIDTRVLHAFLYPIEGMAHDLDSVTAAILGSWKYKHVTSQWVGENETNPKKFLTVPYEALALRNGLDCYACVQVIKPMLRTLTKYDQRWAELVKRGRSSPRDLFFKLVMPMLESLAKMEARGMHVDVEYVKKFREELQADMDSSMRALSRMPAVRSFENQNRLTVLEEAREKKRYPRPDVLRRRMEEARFNPNSRDQVGEILVNHFNVAKTGLPILYTETKKISTAEEALSAYIEFSRTNGLDDLREFIEAIQVYAAAAKGRGTFIDGMMEYVDAAARVHTSYNQDVARTGRLSSSDPNMQNIPIRGKGGKDDIRYRKMFCAKPGFKLISADYSQVELRVLAALGRDRNMIDIFTSGRDFHTETARRAFSVATLEEVTKFQRRAAKAVNFGVVFGQTAKGLGLSLGCSDEEAQDLINVILRNMPGAARWMSYIKAFARKHGIVFTWFGRPRPLGNATLDTKDGGLISAAERRAVNTPVQGTANEICEIAFHAAAKYFEKVSYECAPVAIVHDQVLFECEAGYVETAIPVIRKLCIDVPVKALGPEFVVPLVVDISVGNNWGELEDVK